MKYLGTFTTLAQVEAFLTSHNVSSGKPTDIHPGDHFSLAGNGVFIAGIDTEYNKGNSPLTTHHITCIVDLGTSKMNETNTTSGGYEGASTMKSFLSGKETELTAICGSHLLSRRVLTTNGVGSDGKSNSWNWTDHKLTLMSETQIYGSIQWGNAYDTGEAYEKLPIFNELTPLQLFGRTSMWLRAVHSATNFCGSSTHGFPDYFSANSLCETDALFCLG